ncbi:MAG: D-alanyl-D-alanine carboxypeptidase family protein [Chloroflexota bacterium]
MRVTHHLAVLGLLGAMTLSGIGARWVDEPTAVVMAAPSPSPVVSASSTNIVSSLTASGGTGGGTLPFVMGSPAPTGVVSTVPPLPSLAEPARQWIQNFRATELFDGPGPSATSLGMLPQFTTLELVEQVEDGRSRLFDHGRGEGRTPGEVWANVKDFGPSGPPKYLFELAKGGEVAPGSGKKAPERIAQGWPHLPTAESAVIVDGESGVVLYAKSAHTRMAQASTTKIMTAIVAIENGHLDDRFTVDVNSAELYNTTESTVMGLMPGQTVTLETLLYGLMLPSGNDAAIAIAKHVAGSEARFVEMMNAKARELNLRDTQFKNPHGLDAEGHFSSAYDLAQLARYAMQNPAFYSISVTRHWNADGFDLWNLNKLLASYEGADGVKPGFTDNAGRCLVGSAVRDNRRVFVTVLRSNDTTEDSRALLDYAFASFRWPS